MHPIMLVLLLSTQYHMRATCGLVVSPCVPYHSNISSCQRGILHIQLKWVLSHTHQGNFYSYPPSIMYKWQSGFVASQLMPFHSNILFCQSGIFHIQVKCVSYHRLSVFSIVNYTPTHPERIHSKSLHAISFHCVLLSEKHPWFQHIQILYRHNVFPVTETRKLYSGFRCRVITGSLMGLY